MPLFRGSSRFESLILSHHSRFTCACNKEDINDDDDARAGGGGGLGGSASRPTRRQDRQGLSALEVSNSTKFKSDSTKIFFNALPRGCLSYVFCTDLLQLRPGQLVSPDARTDLKPTPRDGA